MSLAPSLACKYLLMASPYHDCSKYLWFSYHYINLTCANKMSCVLQVPPMMVRPVTCGHLVYSSTQCYTGSFHFITTILRSSSRRYLLQDTPFQSTYLPNVTVICVYVYVQFSLHAMNAFRISVKHKLREP